MLIDGAFAVASDNAWITSLNPATEAEIGRVPAGTKDDVNRAVDAAERAQSGWKQKSIWERGALLRKVAAGFRVRAQEILTMEATDTGNTIAKLRADVEIAAAKKLLAEAEARVTAETGRLEAEVARIKADLEVAEKVLVDDVRETYDRVVKQRGADGMAPIEGHSCGGCFQQLTGNMVSDLIMGRVIPCRSCGRLLYMPDSAPAA